MKNFEVNDNELIRFIPIDCQDGYGTLQIVKIISKDEFIACYNKWIRNENSEQTVETCSEDCSLCANAYSCRKKHI